MKIVNLTGGLGNQMFQYAFALALKCKYPEERVYIDIQHYHTIFFKRYKGINLHNGFEIAKVFPKANIPIARFWQLAKVTYWMPNYVLSRLIRKILPLRNTEYVPSYKLNYVYDRKAIERKGNCYYEGYWQSVYYFSEIKDKLREIFSHPVPNDYNADMIKRISESESVGIHVRRGDYLNEPEFSGICGESYYQKAIMNLKSDGKAHTFFIFSNDIEWCRDHLTPLLKGYSYTFITENTGKNSCWDMFLMTYCKDLIIANSSFSWWGAFLNAHVNRVYAPFPWLNRDCEMDVYEDSWIKVN